MKKDNNKKKVFKNGLLKWSQIDKNSDEKLFEYIPKMVQNCLQNGPKVRGLDIVVVIKALNKDHAFALLEKMNFPFIKKGDN